MKNFEKRRDRFDFFSSFENPLINLSFDLELPDFRPYCKTRNLPIFHFFLHCVLNALSEVENFKYRIYQGEVIKVEEIAGAFTVTNDDNNLNYARVNICPDLDEFIGRSIQAKNEAEKQSELINTGKDLSERELKNNIYVTCFRWLRLAGIEHPIFRQKEADIPAIVWGKFSAPGDSQLTIPFSVQAHHGFVDGYHINLLVETIKSRVARMISTM